MKGTEKGEKGQFLYKKKNSKIIEEDTRQQWDFNAISEDFAKILQFKNMALHLGKTSTHEKVQARFLLYSMFNDVAACFECCQEQKCFLTTVKSELHIFHNALVSQNVMKQ